MVARRGSALLTALLVAVLLFVSGLALVFQMRADYQQRFQAARWTQARALAEAGLEDFRCKLERDAHFPPLQDIEQTVFEYEESLLPQAGYQVRSDVSLRKAPWNLVLVRSQGYLGSVQQPQLLVSLEGEFDVSVKLRATPTVDNPLAYQFRLTRP